MTLTCSQRNPPREAGSTPSFKQLTGAILLYCTLARLRAKNRGRSAAEGGLLILDNPIGTCSNVTMLRVQRRVAEAMGFCPGTEPRARTGKSG